MSPLIFIEGEVLFREDFQLFTDDEITELVESGVLVRLPKSSFKFEFVGAIAFGCRIIYVVPKFEASKTPEVGVFYVKAIQRYLSMSSREQPNPHLDNIPLVMQVFAELNAYYLRFGIFQERRVSEVHDDKSPISWSKTVARNNLMIASFRVDGIDTEVSSIFYPFPVRQSKSSIFGALSELFRKVLTILASFIAPIMRFRHPLELRANYDKLSDLLGSIYSHGDYYRRLLSKHIALENGTRRRVLVVLYNFLVDDNREHLAKLTKCAFTFGVTKFDRIWEDACINAFGADRQSPVLAQPKILNASRPLRVGKQVIDGVVSYENGTKHVLVDAKNYLLSEVVYTSDVMKQFGYYLSSAKERETAKLENALLFPASGNGMSCELVGSVVLNHSGSSIDAAGAIHLIDVDPREALQAYIDRRPSNEMRKALHDLVFATSGLKPAQSDSSGAVIRMVCDTIEVFTADDGRIFISKGSRFKLLATGKTTTQIRVRTAALEKILREHGWAEMWKAVSDRTSGVVKYEGARGVFSQDFQVPDRKFADLLLSDYVNFEYDGDSPWKTVDEPELIVTPESMIASTTDSISIGKSPSSDIGRSHPLSPVSTRRRTSGR